MNVHARRIGILPRWREGIVRVIDIMPRDPLIGPPRVRLAVSVACLDIELRSGLPHPFSRAPWFRHGHLEEALDDHGLPALSVDDRLFRAILPGHEELPLCLAGYHMSFLHGLLGGPWEHEPRRLCLYRTGRLFDLGATNGDFSLEGMADAAGSDGHDLYDPPVATRVAQASVVLRRLLQLSRLNMLVAMSCTKLPPPPATEPFGSAPGWNSCPGGRFFDFE